MSKADVYEIMGVKQTSSYGNPYKTEVLPVEGKKLEVLYYWTSGNRSDGIQEYELTPVMLQDGVVFGWGGNIISEYFEVMNKKKEK